MTPERDWSRTAADTDASWANGGMGSLRIALLFGSAAVALALLIVPFAERQAARSFASSPGVDRMSTGSIQRPSNAYTIRRSVLQRDPNSVCIIRSNGMRTGDC